MMLFVYFIGTEIYLRTLAKESQVVSNVKHVANDKCFYQRKIVVRPISNVKRERSNVH